jgi:hypothetical protein
MDDFVTVNPTDDAAPMESLVEVFRARDEELAQAGCRHDRADPRHPADRVPPPEGGHPRGELARDVEAEADPHPEQEASA